MTPPITHVAIRFRGKVYSLPKPNRHHHVIAKIIEETDADTVNTMGEDQGFLDAEGRYLTRREALAVALANNQVKDVAQIRAGRLFSEDLW